MGQFSVFRDPIFFSKFKTGSIILASVLSFLLLNIFLTNLKIVLAVLEILALSPLIYWSIYEIVRLSDQKNHVINSASLSFITISTTILYSFFLKNPYLIPLSSLIFFAIIWFCFDKKSSNSFSVKILLTIAYFFWNTSFLAIVHHPLIFMWFFLSVVFSDVFAYLIGKEFGKIKCFSFSKNKTLEGAIIPSIFVFLFSFLITQSFLTSIAFLLVSLISQVGDLFYSHRKRLLGIKDFGKLFGYHGGFWDRFDSHAFASFLLWPWMCYIKLNIT